MTGILWCLEISFRKDLFIFLVTFKWFLTLIFDHRNLFFSIYHCPGGKSFLFKKYLSFNNNHSTILKIINPWKKFNINIFQISF